MKFAMRIAYAAVALICSYGCTTFPTDMPDRTAALGDGNIRAELNSSLAALEARLSRGFSDSTDGYIQMSIDSFALGGKHTLRQGVNGGAALHGGAYITEEYFQGRDSGIFLGGLIDWKEGDFGLSLQAQHHFINRAGETRWTGGYNFEFGDDYQQISQLGLIAYWQATGRFSFKGGVNCYYGSDPLPDAPNAPIDREEHDRSACFPVLGIGFNAK